MKKEPLLISACLLGELCRYDGRRVEGKLASLSHTHEENVARLWERFDLILICPECEGGLPTPRTPSERVGDFVFMKDGTDVTAAYQKGAASALVKGTAVGCTQALLKARSPSCGVGCIYDGTFRGTLTAGDGVTAQTLRRAGYRLYTEEDIEKILK